MLNLIGIIAFIAITSLEVALVVREWSPLFEEVGESEDEIGLKALCAYTQTF